MYIQTTLPACLGPTLVSCLRYCLARSSMKASGFIAMSFKVRGAGSLWSMKWTKRKTRKTYPRISRDHQVENVSVLKMRSDLT